MASASTPLAMESARTSFLVQPMIKAHSLERMVSSGKSYVLIASVSSVKNPSEEVDDDDDQGWG